MDPSVSEFESYVEAKREAEIFDGKEKGTI